MQKRPVVWVLAAAGCVLAGVGVGFYLGRGSAAPEADAFAFPPLPPSGGWASSGGSAPVPSAPAAPGTPNAIGALATRDGAPPPVPRLSGESASALRRALVSYTVSYAPTEPERAWECTLAAGTRAIGELATLPKPSAAVLDTAPCGGAGAATLAGRVRLSTQPATRAAGITRCDATLSYKLAVPDAPASAREIRAEGAAAEIEAACGQALAGLQAELLGRLAGLTTAPPQ